MSDFHNLFDDGDSEESNPHSSEWYEVEPENRQQQSIELKEVTIANVVEEIYYPAGHAQGRAESSMWVLLRDSRGREFKIVMLQELGRAILSAIRGEIPDRPFTHDLLRTVIEKLGATVDRVVIDDLWQDTYYAKLHLRVGERVIEIDARPSDAIAVGLRFKAPIFVAETVLEATQVEE